MTILIFKTKRKLQIHKLPHIILDLTFPALTAQTGFAELLGMTAFKICVIAFIKHTHDCWYQSLKGLGRGNSIRHFDTVQGGTIIVHSEGIDLQDQKIYNIQDTIACSSLPLSHLFTNILAYITPLPHTHTLQFPFILVYKWSKLISLGSHF